VKSPIELLEESRPLIILTEIIGFLHDLGKLDNECFKDHNERIRSEFQIDKVKRDDTIPTNKIPHVLVDLANVPLRDLLSKIIPSDIINFLCDGKKEPTLFSPIFYHHYYEDKPQFRPRNRFEELIARADEQDSHEDRGATEDSHEDRRAPRSFYVATPFGYEEPLDQKTEDVLKELDVRDRREARLKFYQEFSYILKGVLNYSNHVSLINDENSWYKFRRGFYEIAGKYFPSSLAETRRPANDIILYDHGYMTGSISKSTIAGITIDEKLRLGFDTLKRYRFKILVVGFDGYSFLTKVNRLPDFIGRLERFERMKNKIRKIVEFELPIGNAVYEDLYVMCFLLPALSPNVESEIESELQKRITSAVQEVTNGFMMPIIKICGDKEGKESEYIGPLIENAKKFLEEKISAPYSTSSELIRDLRWVKDWEKIWMWRCNNCRESGVNGEKLEKCRKCGSNRLGQKLRERCYVCGYAPEYPTPPGMISTRGERLCKYCYELRLEGIIKRGMKGEVMWLDQIRDERPSNRIALIVGKILPIEAWLNGNYISETTFTVFAHPGKGENKRNKLRRMKGILRAKDSKTRLRLYEEVKRVVEHSPKALEFFNSEMEKLLRQRVDDERIESFIQRLTNLLSKKSASPSRLRRVWREFEEFSEESVKIAEKFLENKNLMRKRLILEVDRQLRPNVLGSSETLGTIICRDEKTIETIDYLDVVVEEKDKKLNDLSREEINDWLVGKELKIDWEDGGKEEVRILKVIEVSYYIPLVPIYRVAGEFMLLCPGKYALEIVSLIRDEFYKRFEKVLGRLTLNIGIIYFKYKLPLYLVLDAGRRLIKEFEKLGFREVKFEVVRRDDHYIIPDLRLHVTPRLGDGTEDWYYSAVKVVDGDVYVPLLSITKDAEIKLFLNYFDYEYLESTQNRFNIRLNAIGKRRHRVLGEFGPRPYKLEDIDVIFKMCSLISPDKKRVTTSEIRKLEYICASKIEEWGLKNRNIKDDYKFKKLVEASVRNICEKLNENEKKELIKSILSGMFFDVVELFLTLKSSSPSPFTKISSILGVFKYTREDRRKAEELLMREAIKNR